MQTGEGIMEAAREKDTAARRERDREREVRRELGINEPEDDEGTEDFVVQQRTRQRLQSRRFVHSTSISKALRLNNAEEGESDGDLEIEPETQPPSSQPLRSNLPSSTQPPSSLSAAARSSASLKRVRSEAENSATTAAKKSNAERITERIFPSKEEMDAQRTEDQNTMDSGEAKSVQIKKTELDLEIQSYDFEQRKNAKDLERKQYEMNVSKAEAELAAVKFRRDHEQLQVEKARAELEESKANSKALTAQK
ncbi:hypothetical protein H4Q26_014442 [Puccinia striiformis f. sp. tritici PST-130]|nr:hypothetical protein H4Q26_014442 [Puccinia striiformis f. sp. tritici PST-130]